MKRISEPRTWTDSLDKRHLSESFTIQNGLKEGVVLSPLLFNFALEYANR
jgi:hypothetical protein